ncbi:MAG: hypothetical protein A3I66_05185 [Burkholderiales bacterium RIFCSPLOWO2_02_FULL_57_36]|nr:MAG: hypothetical protein A3I66_05185 [Burkholderiales bacterium RIFCSPLOWO2_02_FULL_57_36]
MRYPQPTNPDVSGSSRHCEASGALVEAISLTAEVCGLALSSGAAKMLASDLADFNESAVLDALARCRMELQGPLKMPDILERIDDGRPEVDDAWTMMPKTESESVVWTDEMAQAWGIASPLLNAGDVAAARNAFKEAYGKAVLQARIKRMPARWMPSLGNDVASRESVLLDAVRKRRLTAAHVAQLLRAEATSPKMQEIFEQVKLKSLH